MTYVVFSHPNFLRKSDPSTICWILSETRSTKRIGPAQAGSKSYLKKEFCKNSPIYELTGYFAFLLNFKKTLKIKPEKSSRKG